MPAQSPPEDLQNPTLAQLLQVAMDGRLEDVHTCQWGSVSSYDAASQTAVVQLPRRKTISGESGERQTERPAPLVGVPVLFPSSGPYSITFPIAAGDSVLVVFGERATHQLAAGADGDVNPDDDRMHSLSDGFAIPGLRASTGAISGPPPNDALVITVPPFATVKLGDKDASEAPAFNSDLKTLIGVIKSALTGDAIPGAVSTAFPTDPAGAQLVQVK